MGAVTTSVVQQVIDEIRRAIVFGKVAPGSELSLRETAARLGTSTAPVREAIRVLQGEGLVVVQPPRSAFVAPLDREDLRSIYRLRRILEPDLAVRSCTGPERPSTAKLEALFATVSRPDLGMHEIYEAHRDLHLAILSPAATAWDLRILETLWQAAQRYVRIGFGRRDPDPEEHHRRGGSHRTLLEAVESGDGARAKRELELHLDESERLASLALV